MRVQEGLAAGREVDAVAAQEVLARYRQVELARHQRALDRILDELEAQVMPALDVHGRGLEAGGVGVDVVEGARGAGQLGGVAVLDDLQVGAHGRAHLS